MTARVLTVFPLDGDAKESGFDVYKNKDGDIVFMEHDDGPCSLFTVIDKNDWLTIRKHIDSIIKEHD